MSLKSTKSSLVIEPANDPSSISSQLLLTGSDRTQTLPHKRGCSPSSSTWPKSTRLKLEQKTKGSERQIRSHSPQDTSCRESWPKTWNQPEVRNLRMEDHLQDQTRGMESPGGIEDCNQRTCLGLTEREKLSYQRTPAMQSQLTSSKILIKTLSQQSYSSDLPQELLEESLCQNGNTSLKGKPLTLTRSSRHCTVLRLIKRERLAWETMRSVSGELKQRGKLSQALSGLPLGDLLGKRLLLFSSTGSENWLIMETTSSNYSQPSNQEHTIMSSSTIGVSGMKLGRSVLAAYRLPVFCIPLHHHNAG